MTDFLTPPTNLAGYDPLRTSGDCHWDAAAAAHAVGFFKDVLTHPDDSPFTKCGDPFVLEPWQANYVATLYGWKRPDGTRRYRESLVGIPRKNGKSTLAAGLVLLELTAMGRRASQIYSAAQSRDQASLVFNMSARMVNANKRLSSKLKVIDSTKRLTYLRTGSFYRAIPAEAGPVHGTKPAVVIFDELHTQKTRDLYEALKTGQGATQDPLFVSITTAGHDRHSICWDVWNRARQIRDGINDNPYFLPLLYELGDDEDWTDETIWNRCNPNLEKSISLPFLRDECSRAKESPSYENTFRNLYLNQWCVAPDTLIWMADGSRKRADELVAGDAIESFDEQTGTIVRGMVTIVSPMDPSPIYEITTSRGRVIRTNAGHPFWSRSGPSVRPVYGWLRADELKIGSRIGVALAKSKRKPGGKVISEEESQFLGIMAGDGTCKGTPRLTSVDPEIITAFQQFVEGRGDRFAALPDGVHFDARHIEPSLKRTATRKFLQHHGMWGKNCNNKEVPRSVFSGSANTWSAFLSGYLDTDGHVSASQVIWVSKSRELLVGCQDLLAYLGIQSTLSVSTEDRHRLVILDRESLDIAGQCLKPQVARKARALAALTGGVRRTGENAGDRRAFDRVVGIRVLDPQPTIGISVHGWHTHITNGLITHNTEQATRWLSMDKWEAMGGELRDLTDRPCWAGLDLSTTTDLSALVLVFPGDDGTYDILPFFWVPEENIRKRSRADGVPYDIWAKEGFIQTTPGNAIDYDYIRKFINELREQYNIQEIACDRWNANQIITQLEGDGFAMAEFGQGYASMSSPSKALEGLVLEAKMRHGDHPVLRWNAANVATETDAAGNIKPSKKRSTERIDGIVALVMGLARAQVATSGPVSGPLFIY